MLAARSSLIHVFYIFLVFCSSCFIYFILWLLFSQSGFVVWMIWWSNKWCSKSILWHCSFSGICFFFMCILFLSILDYSICLSFILPSLLFHLFVVLLRRLDFIDFHFQLSFVPSVSFWSFISDNYRGQCSWFFVFWFDWIFLERLGLICRFLYIFENDGPKK